MQFSNFLEFGFEFFRIFDGKKIREHFDSYSVAESTGFSHPAWFGTLYALIIVIIKVYFNLNN